MKQVNLTTTHSTTATTYMPYYIQTTAIKINELYFAKWKNDGRLKGTHREEEVCVE